MAKRKKRITSRASKRGPRDGQTMTVYLGDEAPGYSAVAQEPVADVEAPPNTTFYVTTDSGDAGAAAHGWARRWRALAVSYRHACRVLKARLEIGESVELKAARAVVEAARVLLREREYYSTDEYWPAHEAQSAAFDEALKRYDEVTGNG